MRFLLLLAVVAVTPSFAADTLRIRAVGDVMLGTTVPEGHLAPDDGAHLLDDVAPLLQDADLTFANMEGPLCDSGTTNKCKSPKSCYAFRSPTRYGKYVKEAGVDLASTANNHSGDFGEVCRRETEATLDALGIVWSGPPGSIGTLEKDGRRIGLVAFHTSAGCNDVNQLGPAVALVKKAKAEHGLVIVSFHGGAEGTKATRVVKGEEMYLGENRGDLVKFTHAVIDAGADLVLGHGPHVLRALEVYRGRLIVYSMGNFATYGRFNLSGPLGVGMVMEVELAKDGTFTRGKILPTQQEGEGVPKKDPAAKAVGMVKKLTELDFPETGPAIADDGVVTPRPGA